MYSVDVDVSNAVVYSLKRARLQALEFLKDYIQNYLNKLEGKQVFENDEVPIIALEWTDSKAALIELAYAIQSKGSLNYGKINIKSVMHSFEKLFQIQLGNYYSVFQQNIRLRKKNRMTYLDQLK